MATAPLKSVASGAIFGAALTAAGVYSPSVIIGQMQLHDFRMLEVFLAASASSAIAIATAQKLSLTACKPRIPNSINWFSSYDGNIVGGLLLGFGLALTGACPGTVLPQVATGIPSGPLVLLGSFLGGVLYSRYGKPLQISCNPEDKIAVEQPAIYQRIGIEKGNALMVYEGLCFGVVALAGYFVPQEGRVILPAAIGGMLIGLSQGASLLLTGNTLGISTAYEQIGDLFWWAEKSFIKGKQEPRPSIKGNAFAIGTILGSFVVSRVVDLPAPVRDVDISALKAVFGGVIMLFGSRLAGGCTSGHGISGMSQLSISSIITVVAMFGGGAALSAFM